MHPRYRRKPDQAVTAVQVALEFDGLDYRKWGHDQHARAGDRLVENGGDVYTIEAESFAKTYRPVSPGRWVKSTPVWFPTTPTAAMPTPSPRSSRSSTSLTRNVHRVPMPMAIRP